jgi:S1-C subfamily serine protease
MRLQCPKCEVNVHVPTLPEDGEKIKCPKCATRFLPPDDEDDDESPRPAKGKKKKGKKKAAARGFPVLPVAIVSVGVVALVVVAAVLLVGGKKKDKDKDTANNSNTSTPPSTSPVTPAGVNGPPVPPQAGNPGPAPSGERPKEMPPEVSKVFTFNENPNQFAPPSSIEAALNIPNKTATRLTVSLPTPPRVANASGKLTRDEVEKAAVYVKVPTARGLASGSGFLIKAEGDLGLIATNFHVIEMAVFPPPGGPPPKVSVVFDSGLKSEVEYPAEVVASEPVRDLAILRIKGRNLPKPLEPRHSQPPKNTQDVLIYGFPLGATLATGGRNPAITIGKATVSSLRRDEDGELEQVQIDGNVNHGNSGGPIVDLDGRLIGITVAKIRDELGTGIGFAIPAEQLVSALEGRVVFPDFLPPQIRNTEAIFHAVIPFSDPLKQMQSANLLVWSGSGAAPSVAKTADGKWKPIAGATAVPIVNPVKGLASADLRFPTNQGNLSVLLQTSITSSSGETIVSQPVAATLRISERASAINQDLSLSMFQQTHVRNGQREGLIYIVRGILTGQPTTLWDKSLLPIADENGRSFPWLFLADNSFATHLKDVTIPAGKGVPVRMAIRVGGTRTDIGPAIRVIRLDVMDGAKAMKTIPPATGAESEQSVLASLNQNPQTFAGRDVVLEGRISMNVRGTAEEPLYTFFLPDGKPADRVVFTSSKALADKFRAVDLPLGAVDRVRATVGVDPEKKINNLPQVTVTKFEFLGRNGEVLKSIDG